MKSICTLARNTIAETIAAPLLVLRDSLFASFVSVALTTSAIPDSLLPLDRAVVVASLSLAGALSLVHLWHINADDWEFYCRPFQRLNRIHKIEDAERKARWLREREQARKEEEAEQARRVKLWQLTRTREDLFPKEGD